MIKYRTNKNFRRSHNPNYFTICLPYITSYKIKTGDAEYIPHIKSIEKLPT